MVTSGATKRLAKEYQQIRLDPPEFAVARPNEKNILEWHYIITGPPDTPYHDGQYYGTLNFPPDYPFKPPSIKMSTPSGRFQCNTRLCLSISDFHPKSWNPSWQVSTILTGLVSFMTSEEMTTGGIATSVQARVAYARESRGQNLRNATFVREFPELAERTRLALASAAAASSSSSSSSGTVAAAGGGRGGRGAVESVDGQGTGPGSREVRPSGSLLGLYWMVGVALVVVLAIVTALVTDA